MDTRVSLQLSRSRTATVMSTCSRLLPVPMMPMARNRFTVSTSTVSRDMICPVWAWS